MWVVAVGEPIKVLEAARIVARLVDGRVHTLTLRPEALAGALDRAFAAWSQPEIIKRWVRWACRGWSASPPWAW